MRRKYREIVMSIGAVALLLLVLISFDDRVKREFSLRWSAGPSAEVTEFGQTARNALDGRRAGGEGSGIGAHAHSRLRVCRQRAPVLHDANLN